MWYQAVRVKRAIQAAKVPQVKNQLLPFEATVRNQHPTLPNEKIAKNYHSNFRAIAAVIVTRVDIHRILFSFYMAIKYSDNKTRKVHV